MILSVVGVSYRSTPLELREKLLVGESELAEALVDLGHGVVLSTCNRTEIYQVADGPEGVDRVCHFLATRSGVPSEALRPNLYHLVGEEAARHLYAVAAGLDSMVVGEPQIMGQVRGALRAAMAAGTAGPILTHVFREALRVGKRARSETFIGRHAVSVSYAAVELARQVFGKLTECRALVVGAGEMGELTTRTLVSHGVGVVAVANRTIANAATLADRFGGSVVTFDRLVPALSAADIVISSTDAPGYVISRADLELAALGRDGRPLFIIDIAVPRDVEPTVRTVPNVVLYDIDDLQSLCNLNREERQRESRKVYDIIDAEAARLTDWWQTRQAIPTIVELRAQADAVRRVELAEAFGKLADLSTEQRAVVDDLTRAIVAKLLHQPTMRLKDLARQADRGSIDLLRSMYGLSGEIEARPSVVSPRASLPTS